LVLLSIGVLTLIETIATFFWVFILTTLGLYGYIRVAHRRRILARDAHKLGETLVADRGGIIMFFIPLFALPLLLTRATIDYPILEIYLALVLSVCIGAIIGLIDDFKDLKLKKALMVAGAGLPIIILKTYCPRPYIPFLGRTLMTIVYILFILILFSVFSDACNMIDIFNGVLIGQGIAILLPILILAILYNSNIGMILAAIGLGYSLGFLVWNRYPARVFHGNVGAYGYGSMISAIIILSALEIRGVEFVSVVAFLPAVFNGFLYVFNTRFAPRSKLARERKPVTYRDGYLSINPDPNAAINLTRLLLLYGKLSEKQLICLYYLLFAVASLLAMITGLLIFYHFI